MPSFKMKIKSTTGCLKEKNGLHVCRKSSMISKNPPSVTRVAQNVEETRSCALSSLDAVSHYDKVHDHDLGGNEDDHDASLKEAKVTQKHQSVTNSATCDCIEPTASTCKSNIEVTFSSTADSVDLHNNEGGDNFCVQHLDSEDSDDIIRSSTEYAAYILSDLFMSDMIFSGPPTQGNLLLSNNMTDTSVLPDCKWEDSSLLCDLAEEYMLLPFLEDSLDAGCDREDRPSEEAITHVDNSSLYMAIHQLRSPNHDCDIDTFLDPHYEWFDSQMYISNHFDQAGTTFSLLPSSVSNEKQNNKQITLVLDLDETLVHSTLDCCDDADFTFTVFFNMKEHIVYVKQRPHLQTFLKRVAEMFEIVVFTASESIYAKQLIDILDPDGKLISRRAYRDSCIFSEGIYMKDLTVLGVDLAKVAIVDNSPQVFRLQVNNGIPIKSWFDDPSDCELFSLLPFLETLVNADDVRPIISRKFGNKE